MTAQRIGIILHDFSTGGSERIAIRLGNAWAKAGRDVTIYCGSEQGALRPLVAANVTVCCCDPPIVRSLTSRLALGLRLATFVRNDQPDAIFIPGNYHLLVVAVLVRFRFVKRPLFICKLSNPVRSQSSPGVLVRLGEWFTRIALAPVSAFTAMSPALRAQALDVFTRHPIFDLAEPILDDDLAPIAPAKDIGKRARIVCAGRLAPQKDFALALRAFALIDSAINAELRIYGEGPLGETLLALATRLGIAERVTFGGYVRDIRASLAGANLFLMTSVFEGYPAVLIEALAAGVPIVTTNCSPAIGEIVTSTKIGDIIDTRDPQAIAKAVTARLKEVDAHYQFRIETTQKHVMAIASSAYLDCFDQLCMTAIVGSSRES